MGAISAYFTTNASAPSTYSIPPSTSALPEMAIASP